jgi:threonine dehydrogenase-like Zn-dependent dehydrogenase
MKAVVWHGIKDVRVEEVPDPKIEQPTDAIVRLTSTAICGSDLHLYGVLGPFIDKGDILGHEPMGVVEEVGAQAAAHVRPGDRVVIPFNFVRAVLDVRAGAVCAVRDDAESCLRDRRVPARLYQVVRAGAGRAGGIPAGADGALRAGQGAGRAAG